MFGFIKKLLFSKASVYKDIEPPKTVELAEADVAPAPVGEWYIPQMGVINAQLVHEKKNGKVLSVTYMGDKNRLEVVNSDGKSTPANITSRSLTTINSRLKKAGEPSIPAELFEQWESELIDAQGKGKGTYHFARFPKKK